LKKQLKSTLDKIQTGGAVDGKQENGVPQDDDMIKKLNDSDGFASRNIL
jgi:hypothetical protein